MRHQEAEETVYAVVKAIPHLGARAGDELIVRPADPDFPVTILRVFDVEMLGTIPAAAVTTLRVSDDNAGASLHLVV
jgi:hypothetical protein